MRATKAPTQAGWLISVLTHSTVAGVLLLTFSSVELPAHQEVSRMLIAIHTVSEVSASPASSVEPPPPDVPSPTPSRHTVAQVPQVKPVQGRISAQHTVVSREIVDVTAVPMREPVSPQLSDVRQDDIQEVVPVAVERAVQRAEVLQDATASVQQAEAEIRPVSSMETSVVAEPLPEPQRVATMTSSQEPPTEAAPPVERAAALVSTTEETVMTPSVVQREVRADYGWLSAALRERIEELKRYPLFAKSRRWEGRVIIEADVEDTGEIVRLQVAESSGYPILDDEAMEVVRKSSPVPLRHQLGQPYITIRVPITHKLHS